MEWSPAELHPRKYLRERKRRFGLKSDLVSFMPFRPYLPDQGAR